MTLTDKTVLITGGTGTFGNAMVARLCGDPTVGKIIVFSRDEYKQHLMAQKFKDPRLSFFLGDIRDKDRLLMAFKHVDVIIHAAALKQVPATEYNPAEAIKTNVLGTQNVIDAALERAVERVMVVSSDKAAHPINLYGATKLCAERIAVASNSYRGEHGTTRVSAIRYGNVLGSRGSIVESIKNQSEGPIPLTDERMTRFWIHIDDVIGVVLEAISVMEGGEIFIPKMKSTRLIDTIEVLAPGRELKIIGIRPGEKLHETLITEHEIMRAHDIGTMYAILPEFVHWKSDNRFADTLLYEGEPYSSDSGAALLTNPADIARLLERA